MHSHHCIDVTRGKHTNTDTSIHCVLVHFIDEFQMDIRGDRDREDRNKPCLFSLFYKSIKCFCYCEITQIEVDT